MLNRRQFLLAGSAAALVGTSGAKSAFAQQNPLPTTTGLVDFPPGGYIDAEMASGSTDPVGIAFVIGIDVSASISSRTNEYQTQLMSLADTIESDDFRESIFMQGGPGSAAIFIIDFGSRSRLSIGGVDLRENDPERFKQLAERIRNIPRSEEGSTNHHAGLENAVYCFDNMPWECDRKHVILKTDGTGTVTHNLIYQRYLAERHEAVVSSLVTKVSSENIYDWCKTNLTTPPDRYRKSGGRGYVPGGLTVEVATEMQTQGTNIGAYKDRVLMAMRRLVITQTAGLEHWNNLEGRAAQFASLSGRSNSGVINSPTFEI